jgi:hypothetical protein
VRKDRRLNAADEENIVELIHSLAIRTKNLRDILLESISVMLNELYAVFTDPEIARRQLLKEQEKNSSIWDTALTEYVRAKYGIRNWLFEKYLKWRENKSCKQWLTSGAETHIERQAALYKAQRASLFEQLEEVAKTSHNKKLKEVFESSVDTPTPRYNYYRQLRWRV